MSIIKKLFISLSLVLLLIICITVGVTMAVHADTKQTITKECK